ncbi:anti-sigma factor [Cyanobium gracile UHCC 0139]|uniref:Regulator of SigK n=1 Tax=Cyanobium gracile UHCC 0139 TaxID=3110308 RepID=A0ABU5RQ66_9CYAN|nr:anti-sigma factor [Cyanobium gracile]MEA5389910.1 anti-sigma factor [Cyanobium gracile UHCC 0139]
MNPDDVPADGSFDALMAGHALGDLDEAEREQLARLLRQQPELEQRLSEFRTTLELLPLALPQTAAPPERLRRRLISGQGTPRRQQAPERPSVPGWLWPTLLGTALLGLGIELHQTRQQLAQIQRQLQPATAAVAPVSRRMTLEALAPGMPGSGEVMVTGNPTNNVLMLNDLPPLPPHHTYRLWANVGGKKVGCVAFVPTAQGHVAMLIPPQPTSQATSVSVSVETDPMGTEPKGPTVLSSSI